MLVTRSKEDWGERRAHIDEGDSYWSAGIDIDDHHNRVICFGQILKDEPGARESAEALRDFIMRAVEAYDGI